MHPQQRIYFYKRTTVSYLDSGTPAFADSIGHSGTRRVDHGHEADEAQFLRGEVHLLCVESEALWELVIGQVEVAEAASEASPATSLC
uniref:Uncharacterized protein n=1 Tax=Scophthalmus maximus TaxID=52904 RepID=A0A8D2ZF60_SCOMX